MKAEDIYKLKLHESLSIPPELEITRVFGGWIYRYWNYESENYYPNGVFVPFNNEFTKEQTMPSDFDEDYFRESIANELSRNELIERICDIQKQYEIIKQSLKD